MRQKNICAIICISLLACEPLLARPRAVAVLSSELGPYQKAFAGFQETFGVPLEKRVLGQGGSGPIDADVIVTFGGKAALAGYPDDASLIYGLALGVYIDAGQRRGQTVKVYLLPEPRILLQRLKSLQPEMKRFVAVWTTEFFGTYCDELAAAGKILEIEVVACQIHSASDLKEKLGSIGGKIDALWVAPDPKLLTEETFSVFKGFCLASRAPFYVSLDGFLEKGAAAAVYVPYKELGKEMGELAKKVLRGEKVSPMIHPTMSFLSLSQSSAERYGLTFGVESLKAADEVKP